MALDRLHADDDIDMVVSDINMPEMDGLTLLQQIPKVDPNIKSIIVSAYGDMENIRTAMNRGAFDFVTKPIDFRDLRVTIDRTLQHLMEWREALASRGTKLVALQNELSVASKMQQSILPTHFPESPRLPASFANMEPARSVGGDLLRRRDAGERSHRHDRCRCVRQGRARRPVHDVYANLDQGLGDWISRSRRRAARGQRPAVRGQRDRDVL